MSDDTQGVESSEDGLSGADAEAEMDAIAAQLAQDAKESYEVQKQEQQEFLDTVAEEEGAEVLETTCNLIGDYTVPLKAKMNGDLMDRMAGVQAQGKQIEANPNEEAHKTPEVVDRMCQILADLIDDAEWNKEKFYAAYRSEGWQPIMKMLNRAFESLEGERERREGAADGFRQQPDGA